MILNVNLGNEHILEYFPNFEYFNCTKPNRLKFSKLNNLTGSQQRAFIIYHILEEVKKHGEIGLNIGAGQCNEPFTLSIDHYYGDKHPLYGGEYHPQLTSKCDKLPFNDNSFQFIIASHVLEHVSNPLETFKEWIRILKIHGALILLVPDGRYEKPAPWDIDHKQFFSPASFTEHILYECDNMGTEVFDTLNNQFSLNYVGRKQ